MPIRYKALAIILIALSASLYTQPTTPSSPAALILEHRSELGLSRTQVRRLHRIDNEFGTTIRPIYIDLLDLRATSRRLARVSDQDDAQEIRRRRARHHALMRQVAKELEETRSSSRDQALKVLTPSQRAKANELTAKLRKR